MSDFTSSYNDYNENSMNLIESVSFTEKMKEERGSKMDKEKGAIFQSMPIIDKIKHHRYFGDQDSSSSSSKHKHHSKYDFRK